MKPTKDAESLLKSRLDSTREEGSTFPLFTLLPHHLPGSSLLNFLLMGRRNKNSQLELELLFDDLTLVPAKQGKEAVLKRAWCEPCGKQFKSKEDLLGHVITSAKHGWCSICCVDCVSQSVLAEHQEEEHSYCSGCDAHFFDEEERHEHAMVAHEERYCSGCRRMFANDHMFNVHTNSSAHITPTISCPIPSCTRKFIHQTAVLQHLNQNTTKHEAIRCVFSCGRYFNGQDALRKHLKKEHPNPLGRLGGSAIGVMDKQVSPRTT